MAKMTIDQRIQKVEDCIAKEELQIEASRDKIKNHSKDLKTLQEQKNKSYASEFLKILAENGLTTDEQKNQFMQMIEQKLKTEKSVSPATPTQPTVPESEDIKS